MSLFGAEIYIKLKNAILCKETVSYNRTLHKRRVGIQLCYICDVSNDCGIIKSDICCSIYGVIDRALQCRICNSKPICPAMRFYIALHIHLAKCGSGTREVEIAYEKYTITISSITCLAAFYALLKTHIIPCCVGRIAATVVSTLQSCANIIAIIGI